ncbi:MAG: hypothetical protein K2Y37_10335 [Pirellulales bacterium]|nr:hypothetical protein [Pirellulales bacterium]
MPVSHSLSSAGEDSPRHRAFWTVWSLVAAFGTYFCMYGFRKPFTAASFDDGELLWGQTFKVVLVTSQVLGYTISKFWGIKVIAEMPPQRRAIGILVLIGLAEVALVGFGLAPRPWNAFYLFLNGLPLGMVFGLVIGFLEGRRLTEALNAGLCASFVLADGVAKSVGAWLLERGIAEDWMPAAAGLLFAGPLAVGVAMLSRIPAPSAADVVARSARTTLSKAERWSLLQRYWLGLGAIVLMYLTITIVRSLRADFAPELWRGLGVAVDETIYSRSEIIVALGVMAINGSLVLVRDNRSAFFSSLAISGLGACLFVGALVARQSGALGGFAFMVLIGLGIYLPYVAVHTTIFERLLAMTRQRGNLGFLIQVADATGYLGYVAVMIARNWIISAGSGAAVAAASSGGELLGFFDSICWLAAATTLVSVGITWRYFAQRSPAAADLELASDAAPGTAP